MKRSFKMIMGREATSLEEANLKPSIIEDGVLRYLVKKAPPFRLTSYQAKQFISNCYDEFFSLRLKEEEDHELSSVLSLESERERIKESQLYLSAKRYVELNIGKHLNITVLEYLSLCRSEQEVFDNLCKELVDEELKVKTKAQKELEDQMKIEKK